MIGEQIQCENTGCTTLFVKKTHNQRYHDDECCRLATNAKIMEKYYAKRAQRLGHIRYCNMCRVTRLNRYNSEQTCGSCLSKREVEKNQAVYNMLSNIALVA
jgi:hypothetical protein